MPLGAAAAHCQTIEAHHLYQENQIFVSALVVKDVSLSVQARNKGMSFPMDSQPNMTDCRKPPEQYRMGNAGQRAQRQLSL